MRVYVLVENQYETSDAIQAIFASKEEASKSIDLICAMRNVSPSRYSVEEYTMFDSALKIRNLYKMTAKINEHLGVVTHVVKSISAILETDAPFHIEENKSTIKVERSTITVIGWDEEGVDDSFKSVYEKKGLKVLS